jgi:hypothetical protein
LVSVAHLAIKFCGDCETSASGTTLIQRETPKSKGDAYDTHRNAYPHPPVLYRADLGLEACAPSGDPSRVTSTAPVVGGDVARAGNKMDQTYREIYMPGKWFLQGGSVISGKEGKAKPIFGE